MSNLASSVSSIALGLLVVVIVSSATMFGLVEGAGHFAWLLGATFAAGFFASRLFSTGSTALSVKARDAEQLIDLDDLTGALSRGAFLDRLELQLRRIRDAESRNQAPPELTLLLIDVDRFKQLNDGFGHSTGDDVLVELVKQAQTRPGWQIGRLGGDEFAVLVEGHEHRELGNDVAAYCAGLRDALHRRKAILAYSGVTIGAASAPMNASFADELLKLADLALYQGKKENRGGLTFFNPEMRKEHGRARQVARDLKAAVLLNEFQLHYQPIVSRDGELASFEALLRWKHPLNGMIPPDQFIPIAEQSGIIDRLGAWVLRRACEDLKSGLIETVAVNISGAQFRHGELPNQIQKILREEGVKADKLILEITETAVISATPFVLEQIKALRQLGFRIALDDFGTGNNSFNMFRSIPVDIVKIDKSYSQGMATDPIAQVFVTAVCQVCKTLGICVVMEGVETEEHHSLALLAGADRIQGYLIGKPAALRDVPSRHRSLGKLNSRI
ncbi:bifunctional diguanylate cyclase/phosphodiesterase [Rhizobium sp. AAP116]|uniref:putative bifunctional diguanylate cyclase/phosphodiesterase n=1 Tax=Rhizobium sp. AAP116 TaxID=1523429 RepID=UPI0006B9DC6D|nr:bifunctional diguanylate cyclase/phosphodiesterase [Rhizobium sp. AAP116]